MVAGHLGRANFNNQAFRSNPTPASRAPILDPTSSACHVGACGDCCGGAECGGGPAGRPGGRTQPWLGLGGIRIFCRAQQDAQSADVDRLDRVMFGSLLWRCASRDWGQLVRPEGSLMNCLSLGRHGRPTCRRSPPLAPAHPPPLPLALPAAESRGALWLAAAAGVGIGIPFNLLLMSPPTAVVSGGARLDSYGAPPV
jgi:hypothetical protein